MRINISGCTNSCGQHHISDIGFLGLERRAHGRAAPGYQMLLGGHLGDMEIEFGEKAVKLPAKRARRSRRAGRRAVRRRARAPARRSRRGSTAPAARPRSARPSRTSTSSPTPEEAPDFYVDFDETGPYVAEVGDERVRDMTDAPSTRTDDAARRRSPTSTSPSWPRVSRRARAASPRPRRSAGRGSASAAGIVLAASFQDCVLIDLAMQVAPDIEVVFLDTQYHFAETLWYVEQVRERYDLNLTRDAAARSSPTTSGRSTPTSAARCARSSRSPRALDGQAGLDDRAAARRGADAGQGADRRPRRRPRHREGQPDRAVDPRRRRRLHADRGLPEHPLRDQGYPSIGCWPCTQPVATGDDPRAGRWAGTGKLECGLHGWPQP